MSGEAGRELERLADWLRARRPTVAITGAGVSTESGIPDFRGSTGLWDEVDPMQVASAQGFYEDPARFYRFWRGRFAAMASAEPNVSHRFLAWLEQEGVLRAVVTQNVDGLHQRAGSRRVLEVHGTFARARCLQCGRPADGRGVLAEPPQSPVPTCGGCGGLLKPDVVLFGELLPPDVFEAAVEAVDAAEVVLVMGTSLQVHPVAGLVPRALHLGKDVAMLNERPGPYDQAASVRLLGPLGETVPRLLEALGLPREALAGPLHAGEVNL